MADFQWGKPPAFEGSQERSSLCLSAEEQKNIDELHEWLQSNGARYTKVLWPSNATKSGSRGAVAADDINTDDYILEIPVKCMMSPPHALNDPVYGETLRAEYQFLVGDTLLAVYIMIEKLKGSTSFYYPYLKMIPTPATVLHWTDAEIKLLQDFGMLAKINSKRNHIKRLYVNMIIPLCEKYPALFPIQDFSFDCFEFAWNTIQARAFGKRLKWSALVPFADFLNHSNVQTKYDFDLDGNGLFRLFPSGANRYNKGAEVFNSYGRRPNDNLLLDYGFSMLHNEWDRVEIIFQLAKNDPNYVSKISLLRDNGLPGIKRLRLSRNGIPLDAMKFLRIVTLTEQELESVEMGKVDKECFDLFDNLKFLENELNSIELLKNGLLAWNDQQETSIAYDENELTALTSEDNEEREEALLTIRLNASASSHKSNGIDNGFVEYAHIDFWHAQCAIMYRLTRKYIVREQLRKLNLLQEVLEKIKNSDKRIETDGVDFQVRQEFRQSMHKLIAILSEEKVFGREADAAYQETIQDLEIAKRKHSKAPQVDCGMYHLIFFYEQFLDYYESKYLAGDILAGLC